MSTLVLLLSYFGVLLPIGLAFRLLRRDPLQLRPRRRADTCWHRRPPTAPPDRYHDQY
jgi:hypothetical protein